MIFHQIRALTRIERLQISENSRRADSTITKDRNDKATGHALEIKLVGGSKFYRRNLIRSSYRFGKISDTITNLKQHFCFVSDQSVEKHNKQVSLLSLRLK